MAKKSYNEKLEDPKNVSQVQTVPPEYAARMGGARMLIANPREYNAIMARVPAGKIVTTDAMKAQLAKKHGADFTCALTCGIFVNICANAAQERGDKNFPYWRTVKAKGELCEKFPGGLEGHKLLLEAEGHKVIIKGKRYLVENFEGKSWKLD